LVDAAAEKADAERLRLLIPPEVSAQLDVAGSQEHAVLMHLLS
jgi:hypothetical protein